MTTAAIRQKLHQYIDATDDQHIKDLLRYVENTQRGSYECTPEELEELHKRAEKVLTGTATTYTIKEAHNYIRSSTK